MDNMNTTVNMYSNLINNYYRDSLLNYYKYKVVHNTFLEAIYGINTKVLKVEKSILALVKRSFTIFDMLDDEDKNNIIDLFNIMIETEEYRMQFLNDNINEGRSIINSINLDKIWEKIEELTIYVNKYTKERS